MFTVVMQVSRSTGEPFKTKQLTMRVSKEMAASEASRKAIELTKNLTANTTVRQTYNENEYIESMNEIAEMTYSVYAGNVAVGKFHVVEVK